MFDDYGILFALGLAVTLLAGLIYVLSASRQRQQGSSSRQDDSRP